MTNNKRTIILIAYPNEKLGELKSLFINEEGSIKRKLEDPPLNAGKIRHMGWDLRTLDQGKILEGKFIRVQNGDRKTIDLYHDGTFIFSGLADENFLAHASEDGFKINSLALIELVYNFISFYREIINDLTIKPNTISVEFRFFNVNLDNKKSYLIPGSIKSSNFMFNDNKHFAPQNEHISEPINFDIKDFEMNEKGKITYKIIEKIYLWFGVSLDKGNIPYTKEKDGVISIDIEQIKK